MTMPQAAGPGLNPFGNPNDEIFDADLTNTQAGGGVPAGTYIGRCTDVKKDTSKQGNPMWTWQFTVSQGPYAGREMLIWTALTDNALWKLAEVTEALGLGQAGEPVRFSKAQALGRPCLMVVEESEYEGKKRSQLARIERMPEAGTGAGALPPQAAGLPTQAQTVPTGAPAAYQQPQAAAAAPARAPALP